MFALARDGKTDRRGVPRPLRLAAIADHHRRDIQLPIVPATVQRLAARLGATAAWALPELGRTYGGTDTRGAPGPGRGAAGPGPPLPAPLPSPPGGGGGPAGFVEAGGKPPRAQ